MKKKKDYDFGAARATCNFVATGSTCDRLHVACKLALLNYAGDIVYSSTEHNGPRVPCVSSEPGMCGHIHAETRALAALDRGISELQLSSSVLTLFVYVTHAPCLACAIDLAARKPEAVVYEHAYRDMSGAKLLAESGAVVMSFPEWKAVGRKP
jgi:deoxycytidylate deaminase